MKRIGRFGEWAYVIGLVVLSFGVALMEKANLGISMVVAPAYILSLKFEFLTFGMAEYLLQAVLLVFMCLALRRFKVTYLFSFVTAFLYGVVLDFAINLVNGLPAASMGLRLLWYVLGMLLCSMGIALLLRTYLAPEVYELVVKEVSQKYGSPIGKTKTVYDCVSMGVAVLLSFLLLGELRGVHLGTLLCALINGSVIGFFTKLFDRFIDFSPRLPLNRYFQ